MLDRAAIATSHLGLTSRMDSVSIKIMDRSWTVERVHSIVAAWHGHQ